MPVKAAADLRNTRTATQMHVFGNLLSMAATVARQSAIATVN
jgi:hypothetical protein